MVLCVTSCVHRWDATGHRLRCYMLTFIESLHFCFPKPNFKLRGHSLPSKPSNARQTPAVSFPSLTLECGDSTLVKVPPSWQRLTAGSSAASNKQTRHKSGPTRRQHYLKEQSAAESHADVTSGAGASSRCSRRHAGGRRRSGTVGAGGVEGG